jgi:hypothetical protein
MSLSISGESLCKETARQRCRYTKKHSHYTESISRSFHVNTHLVDLERF